MVGSIYLRYIIKLFRHRFLNLWMVSFSTLSHFVFMILPGKQPMEFHLCTGSDPNKDSKEIKYHIIVYTAYAVSIIINTIMPIKIALFKYRKKQAMKNQTTPDSNTCVVEFHSLTDLTTSICIVILMGANLNTFFSSYLPDPDFLNTQPVRIYLRQLFIPNFVGVVAMTIYFIRNDNLRFGVVRTIKEYL